MGCDIHVLIERRVNDKWERVPHRVPWREQYDGADPSTLLLPDAFDNRNYDLFGVLAGVRNGTWGEPNPPIAQPRGWPEDSAWPFNVDGDKASPWVGDHSHSWVTLRELEDYPWDARARKRGWVTHEQAAKFRADGIPPSCYAAGGNHGEYIEWTETRLSAVRDWPTIVLPILRTLGSPDDVRLVFGFDS